MASSIIDSVQSRANKALVTSAAGLPTEKPQLSHPSWFSLGAIASIGAISSYAFILFRLHNIYHSLLFNLSWLLSLLINKCLWRSIYPLCKICRIYCVNRSNLIRSLFNRIFIGYVLQTQFYGSKPLNNLNALIIAVSILPHTLCGSLQGHSLLLNKMVNELKISNILLSKKTVALLISCRFNKIGKRRGPKTHKRGILFQHFCNFTYGIVKFFYRSFYIRHILINY